MCFLCGQKGQVSNMGGKLTTPDDWILIEELPEKLHKMDASVRRNIRKD